MAQAELTDLRAKLEKISEDVNRNINPEHAFHRFQYAVEHNPDIDPRRLAVPSEVQDGIYSADRSFSSKLIKAGAKLTLVGIGLGVLGSIELSHIINQENATHFDRVSQYVSVLFPTLLGGFNLGEGIKVLYYGIKHRRESGRSLTERERQLANYVWMKEKPQEEENGR